MGSFFLYRLVDVGALHTELISLRSASRASCQSRSQLEDPRLVLSGHSYLTLFQLKRRLFVYGTYRLYLTHV